jgi:mRNA interferase RelE/StbE
VQHVGNVQIPGQYRVEAPLAPAGPERDQFLVDRYIANCYNVSVKQVLYTASAAKDLKTHGNMRERITKAVSEYATDQKAHKNQVTDLVGINAKRMRVGDLRVIFEETDSQIIVTKIGPRGSIYR